VSLFFPLLILIFSSLIPHPTQILSIPVQIQQQGERTGCTLYRSGFLHGFNFRRKLSRVGLVHIIITELGTVTLTPSDTMTYAVCEYLSFIMSRAIDTPSAHPAQQRSRPCKLQVASCEQPTGVRLKRRVEVNVEEVYGWCLRRPCGTSSAFGVKLFHRVASEHAQVRKCTPPFGEWGGEWGTVREKTSGVASGDGAYLVFSPLARQVRESRSQDTVHKWFEGTVVEPNRPLTSRDESVLDQKCSAGGGWISHRRCLAGAVQVPVYMLTT